MIKTKSNILLWISSSQNSQFRRTTKLFFSLLLLLTTFMIVHPSVSAATYIVTKTADTNDGTCDSDCSFTEAVQASNSNSGADAINFNIPTSDGGYIAPSGDTQGYFSLPLATIYLTDNSGVFIDGYSQSGASRNTAAFGQTINTVLKIQITYSTATTFTISGSNNHITGINYGSVVVHTTDLYITGSSNNWIEGNFFGSDMTGTVSRIGGSFHVANGSSNNTFGTNGDGLDDAGERNLFMGSVGKDYAFTGYVWSDNLSDAGNGNIVAGNYLGVEKSGRSCTSAIIYGMDIQMASSNNRIGTNFDGVSDSEEANIMGCVYVDPITRGYIRLYANISDNLIQGNYIGISPFGDTLGSLVGTGYGAISFLGGGTNNNIVKGNTLSGADYGILQFYSGQNTFSQNKIYDNALLGIKLGTITSPIPNDTGDADSGPNNLMNHPVLKKVVKSESNLIITADLDFNTSEAPFTIELFDNDALDASGYGEGQYFIGSVSTSAIGSNVQLTIPITGTTPTSASKITSTATNVNGSTSEFSTTPTDPTLYSSSYIPSISLSNSTSDGANAKTRLTGTTNTGQYNVTDVQFSVNGGSWNSATPTDNAFNSSNEDFYLDFLTGDNSYTGDGYTVLVKAHNTNDVWTPNALYFQPFNLDSPSNNYFTNNVLPTFSFSVNKNRFSDLKDNLSKFQILINKNNKGWQTYIDDIPVNFESNNGNGIYENNRIWVNYSNNNANISVYSNAVDGSGNSTDKFFEDGGHKLSSGSYQWKVVAVNSAGDTQETETRKLRVSSKQFNGNLTWFPLTVDSISGLGNLNLSTIHPQNVKDIYFTTYLKPTFKGIANAETLVTLISEDLACNVTGGEDCVNIYTTTTGVNSRYLITFPNNALRIGKKYAVTLSANDSGGNYNELPTFTLEIVSPKLNNEINSDQSVKEPSPAVENVMQSNQPIPALTPNKKRCFLFICI